MLRLISWIEEMPPILMSNMLFVVRVLSIRLLGFRTIGDLTVREL